MNVREAVRHAYARACGNASAEHGKRIRSPLRFFGPRSLEGVVEEPVAPPEWPLPLKARRLTLTLAEARKFGQSWLSFDQARGVFEIVRYLPRGPSYAVELPADLTAPLHVALAAALDAMVPLIQEDVDSGEWSA